MLNEQEKELLKEISDLISCLGEYDSSTEEYRNNLVALGKNVQLLDTLTKISSTEDRLKLDKQRSKTDLEIKKEQINFERDKFLNQKEIDKEKADFERKKFEQETKFNQARIDLEKDNIKLKSEELKVKEKSDKKELIITIISCAVPAVIGLISNAIAIKQYEKMAIRALNMEYIDNSITPRSYNECMNNIKNFVSKK